MRKGEAKILFNEGTQLRSMKGRIVGEDEFFVILKRDDGEFRIAKKVIVKIETLNENWREEADVDKQ